METLARYFSEFDAVAVVMAAYRRDVAAYEEWMLAATAVAAALDLPEADDELMKVVRACSMMMAEPDAIGGVDAACALNSASRAMYDVVAPRLLAAWERRCALMQVAHDSSLQQGALPSRPSSVPYSA